MNRALRVLLLVGAMTIFSVAGSTKIMLLGDSITYDDSYADNNNPRPASLRHGYRNHLWYKLSHGGYDVDFVGSKVAGTAIKPPFDPDNEGYPGATSKDIAGLIYNRLSRYSPDIVLLYIGANDWSDSVSGVDRILNEIDRFEHNYSHHVKVVLARIANRREYYSWMSSFNRNLQALADRRIASGDDIVVVDMENGAGINYPSDFQDPTHPNDTGYEKIANAWYKVLENILSTSYRALADVDGDGFADIVGFGNKGVSVALSSGSDFNKASLWLNDFGYDQGWRTAKHLRKMADVNGDGLSDIVAFGNGGVSVALSNGADFDDTRLWLNDFGYNQGWRLDKGIRVLSDVNGDGKSDIVAFGNHGVSVALSNGSDFSNARRWVNDFGYDQGWRNTKGLRMMADVNGDGKSDIVAFGNHGVSVALSNGNSFVNAKRWVNDFGYDQGWRNEKGLRYMADVNDDGKADIVAFGNNGVSVAVSNGSDFENASLWLNNMGYKQNWRNDKHLRVTADVNGDGYTDIVGFGNGGVSVATSTGGSFSNASLWLNDFGYDKGWEVHFSPYQEQQ